MTIDEANDAIGRLVVYRSHPNDDAEQGVITSVSPSLVFVRYGSQVNSQATPPEMLTLALPGPADGNRL